MDRSACLTPLLSTCSMGSHLEEVSDIVHLSRQRESSEVCRQCLSVVGVKPLNELLHEMVYVIDPVQHSTYHLYTCMYTCSVWHNKRCIFMYSHMYICNNVYLATESCIHVIVTQVFARQGIQYLEFGPLSVLRGCVPNPSQFCFQFRIQTL